MEFIIKKLKEKSIPLVFLKKKKNNCETIDFHLKKSWKVT